MLLNERVEQANINFSDVLQSDEERLIMAQRETAVPPFWKGEAVDNVYVHLLFRRA
jgi:hypothetical protein